MNAESSISISAAFIFGMLSFFSPCVLPLVPAYLSYMSGVSIEELASARTSEALKRTGLKSLLFVLGFSTVFVLMGATATSLSQMLLGYMSLLMKVAGVTIIIFGLHITGVFRIPALYREKRFHLKLKNIGFAGAFLIGVMFAFGWTPCIGPVLAGILTLAANSETASKGILLLAMYSLGLGIPFIIAGFATGAALRMLSKAKKHLRKIEIASGVLLILLGILVLTGHLQALSVL